LPLEKANAAELLATAGPILKCSRRRPATTDGHLGHHHPPDELRSVEKIPVIEKHLRRSRRIVRAEGWSTRAACRGSAELGFIVVQIDGMGTANRSKAFHDCR
jgi:hypothetical protein